MAKIKTAVDFARLMDQTAIRITEGDGWAAADVDEVLRFLLDAGRIHEVTPGDWVPQEGTPHEVRTWGIKVDENLIVAVSEARQGSVTEGYDYSAPMYFEGKVEPVVVDVIVPGEPVVLPE